MNKPVFYTVLIIFFLFSNGLKAQENLVPNGSFEEYDTCPQNIGDFNCLHWFSPIITTPDFFAPCDVTGVSSSPVNVWGNQNPKEGNSYTGLVLNAEDGYREYICVNLITSLIKGATYNIEFYVSASDNFNFGSNNFEIYLVKDTASLYTETSMAGTPIILSSINTVNNTLIISDTINWTKLIYKYKAEGIEKYLIIGNFKSQAETQFGINNSIGIDSFYYIDDVSLVQSYDFNLVSNVFTPNNDNVNDELIFIGPPVNSFSIINRWGNRVFYSDYEAKWDGKSGGIMCVDGVYFYIYEFENANKVIEKKTGFIQLIR